MFSVLVTEALTDVYIYYITKVETAGACSVILYN